ncbi:MAG: tetratricopeptide repeat protein, partial [Candidatus Krumholzibacteria bacterium]|nr:tetratricopeptide repeat protein [Candidatus Krumholzibacteria bacterium]
KVRIFVDLGQLDRASEEAKQVFGAIKEMFPTISSMADLMIAGVFAETDNLQRADSLLAPFETVLDTLDEFSLEWYHFSKGNLALNRDRPDSAIAHFEIAAGLNPDNFHIRYRLAESYLKSGRVDDAIKLLDRLLRYFDETRLNRPTFAVRGYYLLGTAYQQAGRSDEAIVQYQTFLEIWKDADPELDEVSDAKNRLEALKNSS